MATVREILGKKGSDVISVPPTETVVKAAQLMNERGIGGLVVTDGKRLAGIFTERDILRRVVAQRRDPAATKVGDVMTSPVTACALETTVEECAAMMTAKRIRHLPVIGEKGLVGLITIGDVLAYQVSEQQATIDYMHHFMFDLR
jgi:CBS domain-containing protein